MKITINIEGLPSLRSLRALPLPSFPRGLGVVVIALSLAFSTYSVATVLSAPRHTLVGVPATIGFEGFLSGVSNGTHTLTFRAYDVATGGSALWTEEQSSVQVTNGLYSVVLGAVTPFTSTTFNGDRWIGVMVDGGSEISPRTRVSSVPFALNADNANKIGGGGTASMVVAFDGPCPSGWTEFGDAQGRVIVGLPTNGELKGTVGTPLTNKEDRTHTHTGAPHSHMINNSQGGLGTGATTADVGVARVSGGYAVANNTMTTNVVSDGNTGTASTGQVIPYVQLRYCKLNGS